MIATVSATTATKLPNTHNVNRCRRSATAPPIATPGGPSTDEPGLEDTDAAGYEIEVELLEWSEQTPGAAFVGRITAGTSAMCTHVLESEFASLGIQCRGVLVVRGKGIWITTR